jgi:hypothetical protein
VDVGQECVDTNHIDGGLTRANDGRTDGDAHTGDGTTVVTHTMPDPSLFCYQGEKRVTIR